MVWFGLVLWHINNWGLFNAQSSLYIYTKYIRFRLFGFYGISTIGVFLMPNPLYTYVLNIYDLIWLGFMAYQTLSVIHAKSILIHINYVLFQTIQFCIITQFKHRVKFESILFQTIQFSVITQFSSIWQINRTLYGATTPGQSTPVSNGNEGVLCIPQGSSITEVSPSDCLVSYQDTRSGSVTSLKKCSRCILPTG